MSDEHLTMEEMEAFTYGRLDGAQKEKVVAHLLKCRDCHQQQSNIGMAGFMEEMENIASHNEQFVRADDPFWGPPYPYQYAGTPPTAEEIRQWEERHELRLPASLADALTRQDGGLLRGKETVICPLKEFQLLSEAKWDESFQCEQIVSQRDKLLYIGFESDAPAFIILDYSAGAEPSVLCLWRDLGDEMRREAESFDALREGRPHDS